MRKHFLILMLLTLLPLASWADGLTIKISDEAATSKPYVHAGYALKVYDGETELQANVTWTLNDEAIVIDYEEGTGYSVTSAGDYVATYQVGEDPAKTGTFKIVKATITIEPKPVGIVYGDDLADLENYCDVSGIVDGENEEAAGLVITPTWPGNNLNAGQYTYSVDAVANSNYKIAYVSKTANFTVSKKNVELRTVAPDAAILYGDVPAAFTSEFVGLGEEAEAEIDETKLGFTVTKDEVTATAPYAWLAVGDWTVTPTYEGEFTNYQVKDYTPATLTVEQRSLKDVAVTLELTGVAASNPYKGAAYEPVVKVKVNGEYAPVADYSVKFYSAPEYDNDELKITGQYKNVNSFYVKVGPTLTANFKKTYTQTNPLFTINKVTVTVQVSDFEKVYNNDDDLTPSAEQLAAGFKWLTFLTLKGEDKTTDFVWPEPETDETDADTYEDELTVDVADLEAVNANYNYNVIPGTLTITAKELVLTAKAAEDVEEGHYTKVSGADDLFANDFDVTGYLPAETEKAAVLEAIFQTGKLPSLKRANTSEIPGSYPLSWNVGTVKENVVNYNVVYTPVEQSLTITAAEGTHVVVTIKPQTKVYDKATTTYTVTEENKNDFYIVSGLVNGDQLQGTLTLTYDGEDVGPHDLIGGGLTLSEEALVHYDTETWPGGIEYVNGELTITPKEITAVTIEKQMVSTTSAINVTKYTATGVCDGDDLGLKVVENVDVEDAKAPHAANEVGVFEHGLIVDDATINPNYTLTMPAAGNFYGKLIRYAGEAVVLNREEPEWEAGAATVTFTDRAISAKKWNSFVLPFDITVAELSQTVGYCIVNTLNEDDSNVDNVRFQIYMDKIEAGTPFLMKTVDDTNMNELTFVTELKDVDAQTVNADGGKVQFTGLFKRTALTDKDRYPVNAGDNDAWRSGKDRTLGAFAAYLHLDNTAARIFVEDFENGATVIKELNLATGEAYAVNGWYTLNGVKLQGAPTEKGIYINNGKKVVLK